MSLPPTSHPHLHVRKLGKGTLPTTVLEVTHVNSILFLHNTHHHFSFDSSCVFVKCQSSLLDCKLLEGSGCALVLIRDPEADVMPGTFKMLRYLLNE